MRNRMRLRRSVSFRFATAAVALLAAGVVGTAAVRFIGAQETPKLESVAQAQPHVQPSVTDGGKFAARIDGAAQAYDSSPATPRPAVSIVNWGGSPSRSNVLIDDVAWGDAQGQDQGKAPPVPQKRPAPHVTRRIEPSLLKVAALQNPPASERPTAEMPAPADHGLWSSTKRTVGRIASFGSSVIGHLVP